MKVFFRIKSKANKPVSIYMRTGRNSESKTGLEVTPKDWNSKTQRAYPRSGQLKNLNKKLDKLQYDAATRSTTTNYNDTILSALVNMIDNTYAHEWSEGTKKNYRSFAKMLEKYGKLQYAEDLDKTAIDNFIAWLVKNEYSKSYINRTIKKLKTVVKELRRLGYDTHAYILEAKTSSQRPEERLIQSLTPEEVELLKHAVMPSSGLENARKLALLQVSIGMRVSDLMRATEDNIRNVQGVWIYDLKNSVKTGKSTSIPFVDSSVAEMLLEEFPYPISDQKFNKHLKECLKIAGVDTPTRGYLVMNGRKRLVERPKYELIASHDLRRSWCQHIYDSGRMPIHKIRLFTQHSDDRTFLLYIGRERNVDQDALELFKAMND